MHIVLSSDIKSMIHKNLNVGLCLNATLHFHLWKLVNKAICQSNEILNICTHDNARFIRGEMQRRNSFLRTNKDCEIPLKDQIICFY